jgi:hypothetical protein
MNETLVYFIFQIIFFQARGEVFIRHWALRRCEGSCIRGGDIGKRRGVCGRALPGKVWNQLPELLWPAQERRSLPGVQRGCLLLGRVQGRGKRIVSQVRCLKQGCQI